MYLYIVVTGSNIYKMLRLCYNIPEKGVEPVYRRYSQVGDGSMPLSQVNRNRVKNIIILLLLIALAVLLVISVPLMMNRGETQSLYIQKIQEECDEAVRQANVLSRTGGAASAADLAKIRCNISAIRAVNSLSQASGRQLIDDNTLMTLLNLVDRYQEQMNQGGQKIINPGEYTTSLQNAMLELQETVSRLE